jgi:hypothetical protein
MEGRGGGEAQGVADQKNPCDILSQCYSRYTQLLLGAKIAPPILDFMSLHFISNLRKKLPIKFCTRNVDKVTRKITGIKFNFHVHNYFT